MEATQTLTGVCFYKITRLQKCDSFHIKFPGNYLVVLVEQVVEVEITDKLFGTAEYSDVSVTRNVFSVISLACARYLKINNITCSWKDLKIRWVSLLRESFDEQWVMHLFSALFWQLHFIWKLYWRLHPSCKDKTSVTNVTSILKKLCMWQI